MKNYKNAKLFDCWDMPDDLCNRYLSLSDLGNDCIEEWGHYSTEVVGLKRPRDQTIEDVNAWLRENGAESGDLILIKHWW